MNLNLTRESDLRRIVAKHGIMMQSLKFGEEAGELTRAMCRSLSGEHNESNLYEEVADVLVMLHQVIVMYDLSEKDIIETIYNQKIDDVCSKLKLKDK